MSLSAIAPEHATTLHTEECDQMLIVTADLCVSVGELMRIRDVSVCLNALIVFCLFIVLFIVRLWILRCPTCWATAWCGADSLTGINLDYFICLNCSHILNKSS